jgi:carboxypeptidase family protein
MSTKTLRVLVVAVVVLFAGALPARAQITSGSVGGSVKDQQGGIIPGATVTLVSETRGTRFTPVMTSENGDFVFVNVPTDTYTVEVTMPGFKTPRGAGFGVATQYQPPRSVQAQVRFSF